MTRGDKICHVLEYVIETDDMGQHRNYSQGQRGHKGHIQSVKGGNHVIITKCTIMVGLHQKVKSEVLVTVYDGV